MGDIIATGLTGSVWPTSRPTVEFDDVSPARHGWGIPLMFVGRLRARMPEKALLEDTPVVLGAIAEGRDRPEATGAACLERVRSGKMAVFAFGPFLRQLRLRYGVRVRSEELDGIARAYGAYSVQIICAVLTQRRYRIDCDTYTGIENGEIFPRDAERFLDAITTCLGLCESEVHALWQKLAYEALRIDAGEGFALGDLSPCALSSLTGERSIGEGGFGQHAAASFGQPRGKGSPRSLTRRNGGRASVAASAA